MIRRFLLGGAVLLLLLVSLAAPVGAQAGGTPIVTLDHEYYINEFGAGLLNDTFVFQNNGTSTIQVPSVQLGIPDTVYSHAAAYAVLPASGYSLSSPADNGTVTTFTITPDSPSLAAGAHTRVELETYLNNILNITAGATTPFGSLLLLSPSVNMEVNSLNLVVVLPNGATLISPPSSFIAAPTSSPPTYSITKVDVTPTILTKYSDLNATNQAYFLPIKVTSIVSTIIPNSNGYPQIQDLVTLRNLASYTISNLPISLLSGSITSVTIVPWSTPPTVDPTVVSVTNGAIALTSAPFSAPIQAGDNFTFAMQYSVPSSLVKTSGSTVTVSLPYTLPIQAVVGSYTVTSLLPSGMHSVGNSKTVVSNATPINQGSISISYSVSTGWGAAQAVPAASLLFAVVFIILALKRPEGEKKEEDEEEEKTVTAMLPDLIKGLEDKVALFSQFQTDVAGKSQGAVTKAELVKVRNEIDSLKTRAINRLNEIRQTAGSKRFLELIGQIQDAEREEDRSAKDLLNLYDQYHGRRMKEETFRRLLSNYRKRWDASTDRLSDLLNLAQREGKQA
ncbi:MAG: hypothetical protein ABSA72_03795 [Nitrososphaerales archaeon]